MHLESSEDPLDPLWNKAQEAAERGDMAGCLFVMKALAQKGVWQIYSRIGELYERGGPGVPKDIDEAVNWYRKAVFEGDDAIGHVGLGRAYYSGLGIPRDPALALKHLERAVSLGRADAGIYLGLMYSQPFGVARDLDRAEKYLRLAIDHEYPYAHLVLARVAFSRWRVVEGLRLWLRGFRLATKIGEKDPGDPRLLGIDRS
jgi:TPR repeat protein